MLHFRILLLFSLSLSACSDKYLTGNVQGQSKLSNDEILYTNADLRLVHRMTGYEDIVRVLPDGRKEATTRPRQYLCAEPSPDVARVVQTAFAAGGDGNANVPVAGGAGSIDASLALQFAVARAEGLAQLTKRLATIQLLRDGLYRACEAHANGALDATGYTALLANYDNIMITMLLGELASGDTGSLATLGGSANAASPELKTGTDPNKDTGPKSSATGDAQRTAPPAVSSSAAGRIEPGGSKEHAAAELLAMQREYFIVPRGNAAILACIQAAHSEFYPKPPHCDQLLRQLPGLIGLANYQRFILRQQEEQAIALKSLVEVYKSSNVKVSPAQLHVDLKAITPSTLTLPQRAEFLNRIASR